MPNDSSNLYRMLLLDECVIWSGICMKIVAKVRVFLTIVWLPRYSSFDQCGMSVQRYLLQYMGSLTYLPIFVLLHDMHVHISYL